MLIRLTVVMIQSLLQLLCRKNDFIVCFLRIIIDKIYIFKLWLLINGN